MKHQVILNGHPGRYLVRHGIGPLYSQDGTDLIEVLNFGVEELDHDVLESLNECMRHLSETQAAMVKEFERDWFALALDFAALDNCDVLGFTQVDNPLYDSGQGYTKRTKTLPNCGECETLEDHIESMAYAMTPLPTAWDK